MPLRGASVRLKAFHGNAVAAVDRLRPGAGKTVQAGLDRVFRTMPRIAGTMAGMTDLRIEGIEVIGAGKVVLDAHSKVFFKIKPYLKLSALSVQFIVSVRPVDTARPMRVYIDHGRGYTVAGSYLLQPLEGESRFGIHIPLPQFVHEVRIDFQGAVVGAAELDAFYIQRSDPRALLRNFLDLSEADQRTIITGKVSSVVAAIRSRRTEIEQDVATSIPMAGLSSAVSHGLLWSAIHSAHSDPLYRSFIGRFNHLTEGDRAWMRQRAESFGTRPFFSVVMPVYNPPVDLLIEAVRSLQAQTYPHWELCLADDASPDFAVRNTIVRLAEEDPRIRYVFRETNGHISESSNAAAALAAGDYLVLMDNDDFLPAHALWTAAYYIDQNPGCKLLYSDEDKFNLEGFHADPYFKGDFDRFLMYGHNLFSHLGIYDRALFNEVGGFRKGYEGSQDYDLTLRCMERIDEKQIVHIPHVLYHWRQVLGSTAIGAGQKDYAFEAAKRSINSHFERMAYPLRSVDSGIPGIASVQTLTVENPQTISIVIPTRNGLGVLKPCIESLMRVADPLVQIVIVDNFSDDAETLAYLDELRRDRNRFVVVRSETDFNFSHLCNLGVQRATGEIICLLNNDTEVVTTDLFHRVRAWLSIDDVGMVGARLLFPDGFLQHFGVYLGIGGGDPEIAVHAHFRRPGAEHTQFSKSKILQQFAAVTAACCFMRRTDWDQIGGMDESFAVAYNDVDLCLRVRQQGLKIICDPGITMIHKESITRGADVNPTKVVRLKREAEHMMAKWGAEGLRDPFFSPNFSARSPYFEVGESPRGPVPWKDPGAAPG